MTLMALPRNLVLKSEYFSFTSFSIYSELESQRIIYISINRLKIGRLKSSLLVNFTAAIRDLLGGNFLTVFHIIFIYFSMPPELLLSEQLAHDTENKKHNLIQLYDKTQR